MTMNRGRHMTWMAMAMLLGAVVSGAAELKTSDEVIKFASEKVDGYKSFTANFTQSMSMMGGQMKNNGVLSFKSPAMMRMEIETQMMGQPQKITAVMGPDRIMWQEMSLGGMKRVMKMDMNKLAQEAPGADPFENVDPKRQWLKNQEKYNYSLAGSEEVHGTPVYVLEGTRKPGVVLSPQEAAIEPFMGKSRVSVGKQDGFMYKVDQLDKSGTNIVMTMEFRNVKLNPSLSDDLFAYKPAADVQVIDMTDTASQMMGGASRQPTNTQKSPATPPPPKD